MHKCSFSLFLLFIGMAVSLPITLYAEDDPAVSDADIAYERTFDFTLRFGMGGFKDSRSPVGDLGGGQLALDIKPRSLPVAISLSSEYYTNSAEPTHPYEISSLYAVNLLYQVASPSHQKLNYFLGGGIGWLKVPKDENEPGVKVKDYAYNLEAGIHLRYFEKLGFYAAARYLTAQKKVNNVKVIDFREHILLLGITYSFSL